MHSRGWHNTKKTHKRCERSNRREGVTSSKHPLPEEEELEIQESDTEILREEAPENTSVQTTNHSRKSDRRTKPPSRYTDDSFETSLRPGK